MEDLKEKTIGLADHVEDLATTFYQLTLVKITQKISDIVSGLVLVLLAGLFGFFVVLFAGVALAWWLGDLVNSRIGGFLLAAAFFLILVLVLSFFRKNKILPLMRNIIIRKIYD